MTPLVVGGDSDIDVLGRGVGIAQSHHGDVDIGCFLDGLGVTAGVGDDDEAGLLERARNVVGEVSRREATRNRLCARMGRELEHRTLPVGASRNYGDVRRVVNGRNDARREDDLLPDLRISTSRSACERCRGHAPGLANIDDVDPVRASLPEVGLHVDLHVLGADMAGGSQQHLNILRGGIEDRREVVWSRRHLEEQ